MAETAEPAAFVAGAKALRGVIEHEQAFGFCDLGDRIVVGALAEQIDRNHGLRLEALLLRRRDAALERGRVDIEGRLIDIDEHRRRTGQRHRLAGRAERKGRTEHRIARADIPGHQHHQQRVGAAGAAHDMPGAGEFGEQLFELRHFRSVDELAMGQHAPDRFIDRCAEPAALCADVDERNWVRKGVC